MIERASERRTHLKPKLHNIPKFSIRIAQTVLALVANRCSGIVKPMKIHNQNDCMQSSADEKEIQPKFGDERKISELLTVISAPKYSHC